MPVRARQIHIAACKLKSLRQLLSGLGTVLQPDKVPACDVAKWPEITDLDKDGSVRITSQCQACLKNNVWPGLGGCFPLIGGIITRQEFIPEPGLIVTGKQDDDGLRMQHRSVQDFSNERRWLSGEGNRLAPFDRFEIDCPQEIEKRAAHLFVTSMDHEYHGFVCCFKTGHRTIQFLHHAQGGVPTAEDCSGSL